VGGKGLERGDVTVCNDKGLQSSESASGAFSGAADAKNAVSDAGADAGLAAVVAAWPKLGEAARAGIMAIVQATGTARGPSGPGLAGDATELQL
jgi:hypothetical protein